MLATLLAAQPEHSFWLPPAASTFAPSTDGLFYFVLLLNVVSFIGVVGAMTYFVMKYKKRSDADRTHPIAGNHTLEIAWSAIPGIILIGVFAWGFQGFMHMSVAPENAEQINVTGQKWSWAFTYPNGGTDSALVVPVDEPIRLTMRSTDVLHSFFVPAFRVKRDVLPNRYTVLWFEPTEVGEYPIYCTEYCGFDHSQMISTVRVVSRSEYESYLSGLGGCGDDQTLEECGEQVYTRSACAGCHSLDGSSGIGPTFTGLYGSERVFVDGSSATADEDYLHQSIVDPASQVVEGYSPVMPGNYGQQLSEEQLTAVIAYIRSLGDQ